jgi:hypothetical protein
MNPNSSEKLYIASIISAIKENHVDIVVPIGFIDFLLLSKHKEVLEKYARAITEAIPSYSKHGLE